MDYMNEMSDNVNRLMLEDCIIGKEIYLFGHCNATEKLVDFLLDKKIPVKAILDNSKVKHGKKYRGILIVPPERILSDENQVVLIATRFFEEMKKQLRTLGFDGEIHKLIDYNTYAEYSLSEETMERKKKRVELGEHIINEIEKKYPGKFKIYCPFPALGDIYFCMSYLPFFLTKRKIEDCIIITSADACRKVVRLFGDYTVEVLPQKELDAMIQASLYINDDNSFIAHQDRPYVVNLFKALYLKKISLEKMYCCGVFGLPWDTSPVEPSESVPLGEQERGNAYGWREFPALDIIEAGNAAILSPYAKSVTAIPQKIWEGIVADCLNRGMQVFTNVSGDEKPLNGTQSITPDIAEMKSVVERAGLFIGIRSGLCDVIRTAKCRKIALYPDYYYCDTKWKAIDIYKIEGFENIVIDNNYSSYYKDYDIVFFPHNVIISID